MARTHRFPSQEYQRGMPNRQGGTDALGCSAPLARLSSDHEVTSMSVQKRRLAAAYRRGRLPSSRPDPAVTMTAPDVMEDAIARRPAGTDTGPLVAVAGLVPQGDGGFEGLSGTGCGCPAHARMTQVSGGRPVRSRGRPAGFDVCGSAMEKGAASLPKSAVAAGFPERLTPFDVFSGRAL